MFRLFLLLIAIGGYLYWSGYFTPPPPEPEVMAWTTPRTLRTTLGQVYENTTIRSVDRNGVVIESNRQVLKVPTHLIPPATLAEIVRATPAKGSPTPFRGGRTALDVRPVKADAADEPPPPARSADGHRIIPGQPQGLRVP